MKIALAYSTVIPGNLSDIFFMVEAENFMQATRRCASKSSWLSTTPPITNTIDS